MPLALDVTGVVDLARLLGTQWPASVRQELREAARAERRGDFVAAVAFYTQAESAARQAAQPSSSSQAARLGASDAEAAAKLATIALARAAALEQGGRTADAFRAYDAAFTSLAASSAPHDQMCAVALAQKLGDLASSGLVVLPAPAAEAGSSAAAANQLQDMDALAEKYYLYAVDTMSPLAIAPDALDRSAPLLADAPLQQPVQAAFSPLAPVDVPAWAQSADLGLAIESLAAFYAAHDKPERAAKLYNQAISLIMSPEAAAAVPRTPAALVPLPAVGRAAQQAAAAVAEPGAEARCHAGVLYYQLTSALLLAAERPWHEQGATRAEAAARQTTLRSRAMATAREGLALVRATEADLGIPASPDPVTAVGQGSPAPLSSLVPPLAPARGADTTGAAAATQEECKLAEAGLLFALGRAVAAQSGGGADRARGLYAAAAETAQPVAAPTPLTDAHLTSLTPIEEPVSHDTREAAAHLLAEIAHAQSL